jgi:hypothetical protein
MRMARHSQTGAHGLNPRFDPFPEGIGIGVEMHSHSTTLQYKIPQAGHRITLSDEQTATEGFQIPG